MASAAVVCYLSIYLSTYLPTYLPMFTVLSLFLGSFLEGFSEVSQPWNQLTIISGVRDVAIIFYTHLLMPQRFHEQVAEAFPELWNAEIEFPLERLVRNPPQRMILPRKPNGI